MKMSAAPKIEKKVKTEKVEKAKAPPFKMEGVASKPLRKYRKGSKYDAIVDSFINSPQTLVTLEMPNVKANYISSQIMKRLVARELTKTIDVSVVNNVTYLEKFKPKT